MKKKIIALIVGSFILILLSINSCDINNCGPFADKFKTDSLQWSFFSGNYSDSIDLFLSGNEILPDTIAHQKLFLSITPWTKSYFSLLNRLSSFELISSAYACSPAIPTTDERINNIEIFSDNILNSAYEKENNLAELFYIIVFENINNYTYKKYNLTDWLATKPYVPSQMSLQLKQAPDSIRNHVFTVKYYQEGIDNDYFEFKTDSVLISN